MSFDQNAVFVIKPDHPALHFIIEAVGKILGIKSDSEISMTRLVSIVTETFNMFFVNKVMTLDENIIEIVLEKLHISTTEEEFWAVLSDNLKTTKEQILAEYFMEVEDNMK